MAHKPPLGKIKWLHQAIEEGGDCLWCKKPMSLWCSRKYAPYTIRQRSDGMSESNFEGWNRVIRTHPMRSREPMWDQAIKYLVSEGVMEPTMCYALTSDQIAAMMQSQGYSVCGTIIDFGIWVKKNEAHLAERYNDYMNELWLAYLMESHYMMEWDGEKWIDIG